jgi:DNA-binding NtrC family response regulator
MDNMTKDDIVLIVDDEKVMRESLVEWLQEDGFGVRAAESGMEALQIMDQIEPVVLVADIKMPGMDGITLVRKVKERRPDLPIIMITAFATVENAIQSMKEGAYDFITKPFPPEKLSHVLRHVIEHQHLKRENILLRKERKHILQIAISSLVGFIILVFALYFIFGN